MSWIWNYKNSNLDFKCCFFQPYDKQPDADANGSDKKKSMGDTKVEKELTSLEEKFLGSGRTGRRNALIVSDVTDPQHANTSTADLPKALEALDSLSSSKTTGECWRQFSLFDNNK